MTRLWAALGVRGKHLVVSLGLIIVAVVVFDGIARRFVEAAVVARIEDELWRAAGATGLLLSSFVPDGATGAVDELVDERVDDLATNFDARLTVIDAHGRVVADSELDGEALARVGNHNDRPEVIAARAEGRGVARRNSATVAVDSLYVARSFGDRVVRASLPLSALAAALDSVRRFFVLASLVAVAVAAIGATVTSHAVSRRLRALLATAQRVRRTDRTAGDGVLDDVDHLARSFDELTGNLESNLHALAAERDRFDGLLQAMSEGVVALDTAGCVVLINGAARSLLRVDVGDAPIDPLHRPLAVAALHPLIEAALAGRDGSTEIEVAHPGEERPRRILVRATVTAGAGIVLVAHDISEVRRLEVLRKDFVANVSHELRTPCSVILANAETLMDGALQDSTRAPKFVEAIHRNAERLSRLIADLLELSKIEAGKAVFAREPVNLLEAVEHVVDAVEPRAREKGLSLAVNVADDLLIEADPKALDQVLINLIDNAVKYTPAGGNVRVGAARSDDGRLVARLVIEDDGPGVEGKHKERLFERFYRVDSGRSRDVGGTGLGLAIVKHLVEAMDGTVGVEDAVWKTGDEAGVPEPRRGTRFWVELPLGVSTDLGAGEERTKGRLSRAKSGPGAARERPL